MNYVDFIRELEGGDPLRGRAVHIEEIPAAEARYAPLAAPLSDEVQLALERTGIRNLYIHQARAIDLARRGKNLVIATSTASGKTLCYNVPVADRLIANRAASALYLFPTKALAQDQLRAIRDFGKDIPPLEAALAAGTYDGDTPSSSRKKIRQSMRIILTNPDMLHTGILPYHTKWADFFEGLSFVVLDEIHQYRGVFGSNVANVLRRLRRICAKYGANPVYVCCSATIANPGELAEQLTGEEMELISDDGSPRGKKYFVLWNPPILPRRRSLRKSSNVEAKDILIQLVKKHVPTIVFTNARIVAELIYRYASDELKGQSPELARLLKPYRGGYLPSERREIERQLFSGELLAVTATSALELGICLLYTSPSPRDATLSRMPSSA